MTALEIKYDLIKSIVQIEDKSVLGKMRDYLENIQGDTIPDGSDMSIEEIDRLLLQSETDERISYEDFFKKYRQ